MKRVFVSVKFQKYNTIKTKHFYTFLLILVWYFGITLSINAQNHSALLYEKNDVTSNNWTAKQPSDITYSPIQFNRSVLNEMRSREIQQIFIPGPNDELYTAEILKIVHSDNGGWSAIGFVNDNRLNDFVLSYSPSTGKVLSSVNVFSEHSFFELRYDSNQNGHILVERDPHQSDELACRHSDQLIITGDNSSHDKRSSKITPSRDHEFSVIDVMIVYTPNAEEWAGTFSSGIDNVVNQAMAVAQLASDNSGLNIEFRLVHSQLINYSESGDSELDLHRLTASPTFNHWGAESEGYMDEIHQLRDDYNADLVALFTETDDTGGLAWIINHEDGLPHYAFSITRIQQADGRTHAHEIGHNFGNAHSRDQSQNAASSEGGVFPYSTGWRWTGNDGFEYASVMTYLEGSRQALLFSNPDILYEGVPSGSYEGEFAPADNARSMREVQHVVENYRVQTAGAEPPQVSTSSVSEITYSLALAGGNVIDDGGADVNQRGICWDINPNPNFEDDCEAAGSGLGSFEISLTNLEQATEYFVRAFATNAVGTTFGSQENFTTKTLSPPAALPAEDINAVSFRAKWSDVPDAEQYFLDVSPNSDFSFFVRGFDNMNVGDNTSFLVTDLDPGRDYYFRVRAAAETINSNYSNAEGLTTTDISAENSEVDVSRDRVLATGVQQSMIQVRVNSSNGGPVPGAEVIVEQNEGSSTISPHEAVTDSDGMVTFSITNTTEEIVQYNILAAGLNIAEEIVIEFLFSEGKLTLGNNYPNPYNHQTTIPIVIPEPTRVRLDVFNSVGSLVKNITDKEFSVGYYEIPFNAGGLSSGVYFYRIVTDQGMKVEKMLLAK